MQIQHKIPCYCKSVNLCARWNRLLFPAEWETWNKCDLYAVDITAQMYQAVSTLSWEKNSHQKQKKSSWLHLLKSPKEAKVRRTVKKKGAHTPTNTSWSPGQSWICMGLPDNWALSRQKPMFSSPDRNSVHPQPLVLTPPLPYRSHMAPNNQITALIVTIIQHFPLQLNAPPCHLGYELIGASAICQRTCSLCIEKSALSHLTTWEF